MPEDRLPLFCHARDVADAHVLAIRHYPQSAGTRYLLQGGTFTWAQAVHYIAQSHPDLKSRLPKGWESADPNAKREGDFAKLDTTKARKVLGMQEFRDWRSTLDECVDDLLKLEKTPGWAN